MKKLKSLTFFAVLLLAAFSLHAQIPKEAKFYTLPVRGAGSKEAKSFLYDRVNYEIAFQNYDLLWARRGSDYIIRGTVYSVLEETGGAAPVTRGLNPRVSSGGGRREFLSWEVRDTALFYDASTNKNSREYNEEFVLVLSLMLSRTNEVMDEKLLVFNALNEELEKGISALMTEFFMGINAGHGYEEVEIIPAYIAESVPEEKKEKKSNQRGPGDWRDKFLFIKAAVIWAPREEIESKDINYLNAGGSLGAEFQFFPFVSVELGAQITQETMGGEDNCDILVDLSLALKFVLKPGSLFMIEPYGGVYYNYLALKDRVEPSEFSYFAGIELNIKTGLGIFVIDPRIIIDLKESTFGPGIEQKRKVFQVGIGYKVGFIQKVALKPE